MSYIQQTALKDATYLSIPEADVFLLCSSPADVVKELASKKLITVVDETISKENGPNAILMSELGVENLSFRNVIEFPILQMLYKQGVAFLDLKKYPLKKPKLIFHSYKDFLKQQKAFRIGGYGFTSIEKMMSYGLSLEDATDLYHVKLAFAGGEFRELEELVDVIFLDKKTHIKNGVYVQKVAFNEYIVSYKDESCRVDLKLGQPDPFYNPFSLPMKHIRYDDYFSVTHLGEGDGWNPDLPSMSSLIHFNGKLYLVDAPPNVKYALKRLGVGLNNLDGIFHTHNHDDHFCDILNLQRNNTTIKYFSVPVVRANMVEKVEALYYRKPVDSFFDFEDLQLDEWNDIDGLEVKPFLSAHPIETVCYIFRAKNPRTGEYKTYGHYADISTFDLLRGFAKKNVSQRFIDKILHNYLLPLDIKKLDVGGGFIHGQHTDFGEDKSAIIHYSHLCHANGKLAKIAFGHKDVLIEGEPNSSEQHIVSTLTKLFPASSQEDIVTAAKTHRVIEPGQSLCKMGDKIEEITFIVYGFAHSEHHSEAMDIDRTIIPYSGIGYMESLGMGLDTYLFDYTSISYMDVVTLPLNVARAKFHANCAKFLQLQGITNHPILKHNFSCHTGNYIVDNSEFVYFKKGEVIEFEDLGDTVYGFVDGKANIKSFGKTIDSLQAGDSISNVYNLVDYRLFVCNIEIEEDAKLIAIDAKCTDSAPILLGVVLNQIYYLNKTIAHSIFEYEMLFPNDFCFERPYMTMDVNQYIVQNCNLLYFILEHHPKCLKEINACCDRIMQTITNTTLSTNKDLQERIAQCKVNPDHDNMISTLQWIKDNIELVSNGINESHESLDRFMAST